MAKDKPIFDPLLLSQARLGVITVLLSRSDATFTELKALLGLTQGNLGAHLQQLEKANYVEVRKEFVGRMPRTSARITAEGRKAFLSHVNQLSQIAESEDSSSSSDSAGDEEQ